MKVSANGKTFTFPEGTSTEDMGAAIDEYFSGEASSTIDAGESQALNPIEEAARGLINIPFDLLQGGANVINAASNAVGGRDLLDPVYRPVDRPADPWAQAGEAIGNYLVPGVGAAGGAMIGSVANAGNETGDFAENATKEMLINAALMGAPAAYRGVKQLIKGGRGNKAAAEASITTANEVNKLARTAAGRQKLSTEASQVSDGLRSAAETAGIDINAFTPGMRSGSQGIAQAEGVLASTSGKVQDAHQATFSNIITKFNRNMDEFGAAAGNASEKSMTLRQRIIKNLDDMRNAENAAWNDIRSTMPSYRQQMRNARAVILAEKSAGVPLSPEMKMLMGTNQNGVTFEGMKAWRAKFADAEIKYKRTGEANAARRASEVRRALTDDMYSMAQEGGFAEGWTAANDLSKLRLSAQESAQSLFGKQLTDDVVITRGVKALRDASEKGLNSASGFHTIVSALPESERVPAVASMLQTAISTGIRGGKSDAAAVNHIATILTAQNSAAISRYSPELGKMAAAYGKLARAAMRPQRYVEQTGRSVPALNEMNAGLPGIINTVLGSAGNSITGAVAGAAGGGIIGAITGATIGALAKGAITKISMSRSGRTAIEKALQAGTVAVQSGATPGAMAAAEKRFLADRVAISAIREAVSPEEFSRLARAGFVATFLGMNAESDAEAEGRGGG